MNTQMRWGWTFAFLMGAFLVSEAANAISMRWGLATPDASGTWPSTANLNYSGEASIWRGTPYALIAVLEGFDGELIYGATVDLRETLLGRVGDEILNREVAVSGPDPTNPLWEWGRYRGEGTFYLDRYRYLSYADHFGLDPDVPFPAISGDGWFAAIMPFSGCLIDWDPTGENAPTPDQPFYRPYYYPCTRTYNLTYNFITTAGDFQGRSAFNVHIPEPGTLALFGFGLVGLGVTRRRGVL